VGKAKFERVLLGHDGSTTTREPPPRVALGDEAAHAHRPARRQQVVGPLPAETIRKSKSPIGVARVCEGTGQRVS
jgi:hypothetical protein